MEEEWKVVPYATDYAVSSFGRVKRVVDSAKFKAGRLLRHGLTSRGKAYYYVVLVENDGKQRSQAVHRIVCRTFHGEPPTPSHQVAHSDGNSHNNRHDNLRWASAKENNIDKIAHGTMLVGESCGKSNLTEDDIRYIRRSTEKTTEMAKRYGVSQPIISRIRNRKIWRHVE